MEELQPIGDQLSTQAAHFYFAWVIEIIDLMSVGSVNIALEREKAAARTVKVISPGDKCASESELPTETWTVGLIALFSLGRLGLMSPDRRLARRLSCRR
jgi:hypothetical protein